MKKSQGMSLNVVVIATIVVLILIVLSVIFIRRTGDFLRDTQSCQILGGVCSRSVTCDIQDTEGDTSKQYMVSPRGECPPIGSAIQYCCISIN
jgi:hypothetical protein